MGSYFLPFVCFNYLFTYSIGWDPVQLFSCADYYYFLLFLILCAALWSAVWLFYMCYINKVKLETCDHRMRPLLQVNACQMKTWPLWFSQAKGDYRAQIIPSWHFRPVVSLVFWTRTGGEMSPSLFTLGILQLNVTLRPHMARAFALCQWRTVRLIWVTFSIMLMLTLTVTYLHSI